MLKVLHFADAHIDMANFGRHDPQTGLPMRVMDFLKSLDAITDTAIDENVDLVLFAGDAFKDRTPSPTYQREWGRRIVRLSRAKIPTVLLVGNHDLSPAMGRAHAMEAFDTLDVPYVTVIEKPMLLGPDELGGLQLQIIGLPWVSRSGFLAYMWMADENALKAAEQLEERLTDLVHGWLDNKVDPELPVILTAHCSIQGATYGGERTVMLGNDLVLPGSLVTDPRLDYVALGHIHKHQDLNEGHHPPVVYPGSIERVDFGEVDDDKYFVIANVEKGHTEVSWRKLDIRPFIDRYAKLTSDENVTDQLRSALPPQEDLKDAVVRLIVDYPREWETLIDEAALQEYAADSFEFKLVKRAQTEMRIRLPEDTAIGTLSPLELLELYWKANRVEPEDIEPLQALAKEVIQNTSEGESIV